MDFPDSMFDYMADFIFNGMVPDTYDYTTLFGLSKGKGRNLKMLRYTLGKDWDAKLLEARISERMKPLRIAKNCPKCKQGDKEQLKHLKFFDKEGLIDTHNVHKG